VSVRLLRPLLLAVGLAVVAWLVLDLGPAAVWEAIHTLSWRLGRVVLFPFAVALLALQPSRAVTTLRLQPERRRSGRHAPARPRPPCRRVGDDFPPRRTIAQVEHHLGALVPRVGLLVPTLPGTNRAVVHCYNQRGTAEQGIKEGTHEVRRLLGVTAYNQGNLLRWLVLPLAIQSWSLTSLQQRLCKTGGRPIRHARHFVLQLAKSHLTPPLFRQILGRIERTGHGGMETRGVRSRRGCLCDGLGTGGAPRSTRGQRGRTRENSLSSI
jgi:hypothetical protein